MFNIRYKFTPLLAGFILTCILLSAVAAPTRAFAADQQLQLKDLVLDNTDGQIAIRFGLGFTELDELRLMLKEGAQLTMECDATLSEPGTLWLDTTLTQQTISSVLSFNVLTREYTITMSNQTTQHKNNSLVKLLGDTWEKLSLNVGQLANLERGKNYRIDLKIRAESNNIPPWLAKTLFFWSWNVAPSMHYSMHFTF